MRHAVVLDACQSACALPRFLVAATLEDFHCEVVRGLQTTPSQRSSLAVHVNTLSVGTEAKRPLWLRCSRMPCLGFYTRCAAALVSGSHQVKTNRLEKGGPKGTSS